MKILHTADWHLGNTFHNYSRTAEHKHFLTWLLEKLKEQQPDALIISGDIFDTPNPSAVAEELLYDFLLRATLNVPGLQIVMTAGNHDSAGRLEAPAALLKTHNIYVRGTIHRNDKDEPTFNYYILPLADRQTGQAACVCIALPYLRGGDYPIGMTPEEGLRYFFKKIQRNLSQTDFKGLPVIAAAHFYAAGSIICQDEHSERLVIGGQDCVCVDVIDKNVCYAGLGHIHKAQRIANTNAYYAGSALPMSFSEINYQHGIQCVEIDQHGNSSVNQITYTPLRSLISIPNNRSTTNSTQVFEEIAQLPQRKKGDNGETWPYLELRIEEKQPEPTLLHDVMEALQDKAVHYCRMVRVRSNNAYNNGDKDMENNNNTLASITPFNMARSFFKSRFDNDMPEPLAKRFKMAEETAIKTDE